MAMFRRLLTSSRSKSKSSKAKQSVEDLALEKRIEFERLKMKWKEELEARSDFLVIKSTEEQREAGVRELIDTASVINRDGLPLLRAVFGVELFNRDEIALWTERDVLSVRAESLEDSECCVFKRTLVRKLHLPRNVDSRRMFCHFLPSGALVVEMPLHLLPRKQPKGSDSNPTPLLVPIIDDEALGRRVIRISLRIGSDFTADDVKVSVVAEQLTIAASYSEEIGERGSEVTRREVLRRFNLPEQRDGVKVEAFRHCVTADGFVHVEMLLKGEAEFRCHVTTEELLPTNQDEENGEKEGLDDDGQLSQDEFSGHDNEEYYDQSNQYYYGDQDCHSNQDCYSNQDYRSNQDCHSNQDCRNNEDYQSNQNYLGKHPLTSNYDDDNENITEVLNIERNVDK